MHRHEKYATLSERCHADSRLLKMRLVSIPILQLVHAMG